LDLEKLDPHMTQRIRLMCASKYGKRYVLEVDIRKFFDTINQQWLLDNIPMDASYENSLKQEFWTRITSRQEK
jgi:retron-type reverse transcriptase